MSMFNLLYPSIVAAIENLQTVSNKKEFRHILTDIRDLWKQTEVYTVKQLDELKLSRFVNFSPDFFLSDLTWLMYISNDDPKYVYRMLMDKINNIKDRLNNV